MLIGELQRHRQSGSTDRGSIGGKLAARTFGARIERHGGEAPSLVEIVVDVVGIEGGIPGAEAWASPQPRLDLGHERVEITVIGLIERAGAFGQHDLGVTAPKPKGLGLHGDAAPSHNIKD